MLSQYKPQTALYFGHRFTTTFPPYSYMAGGAYVLSKKTLMKLEKLFTDPEICRRDTGGNEDLEMGNLTYYDVLSNDH